MNESPIPTVTPTTPQLQNDRAIGELRDAVPRLDVVPGETLTERFIQDGFNVSRTPARAALARLATEGLVEREGRGWKVTKIDAHDLALISDFREVVETAAIRRVIMSATDEQMTRLTPHTTTRRRVPSQRSTDRQPASSGESDFTAISQC